MKEATDQLYSASGDALSAEQAPASGQPELPDVDELVQQIEGPKKQPAQGKASQSASADAAAKVAAKQAKQRAKKDRQRARRAEAAAADAEDSSATKVRIQVMGSV